MRPFALSTRRNAEGVALLTVLGILALLTVMGLATVSYVAHQTDEARLRLDTLRAEHIAQGGLQAAIALIEERLAAEEGRHGEAWEDAVSIPVYVVDGGGEPAAASHVWGEAVFTVEDELGRVNLNFAPPDLLERLGFSPEDAAAVAEYVRPGGNGARWLSSVDGVVTAAGLDPGAAGALETGWFTVYSAPPGAPPGAYLNVNTLPTDVLAAVLDVSAEQADEAAARRPFQNARALAYAAGKRPEAFLLAPPEGEPEGTAEALAFRSRTYRVAVEGRLVEEGDGVEEDEGGQRTRLVRRVSAVVHFPVDGPPEILRAWPGGAP